MSNGIWIIGGGGHAKVVAGAALAAGMKIEGLLDDDRKLDGSQVLGHGVMMTPGADWWRERRSAIIGIGNNQIRNRLATELEADWTSVHHPHGWSDRSVEIGEGTLVCAGAVIQPDVVIGAHAILNTRCSIDHDCRIGAFSHIAPGATLAGEVSIAEGCFVGAGATILPGISVGAGAVIGAGAVVTRTVEAGATIVGIPARRMSQ